MYVVLLISLFPLPVSISYFSIKTDINLSYIFLITQRIVHVFLVFGQHSNIPFVLSSLALAQKVLIYTS